MEWVPFYKGHRIYNEHDKSNDRWIWNYDFHCTPGEVYFTKDEMSWAKSVGDGFIFIEPDVPAYKSSAVNKTWPEERYRAVADAFASDGLEIVQFGHSRTKIAGARVIMTPSFRHAVAAMSQAALYIGPEGGLHHAAAAVGIPGVVLFGGFIPPSITGYAGHTNLTGGVEACGSLRPCVHCRAAMESIRVDEVISAGRKHLNG